jgi:hypothetical protein
MLMRVEASYHYDASEGANRPLMCQPSRCRVSRFM